ncbi:S8 family peptidase [Clostridium isatidis]|uniref:S8 family peptidase n=1 Tax=Clostridium isatidis TaxID=182773 RepID=UPI003AB06180
MKKLRVFILIFILLNLFTACKNNTDLIRIAVIDTGINKEVLRKNTVLDGWNYVLRSDNTEDPDGHGTMVSSLIVGSKDGKIKGKSKKVNLIPLVCSGINEYGKEMKNTPSLAAQAIRDAIDKYNCKIINISSGVLEDIENLRAAVEYAEEKRVVVISSAGNDGNEEIYYPAGYDTVISVGSLDINGDIAEFSQKNNRVDVLVKGTDIKVIGNDGNVYRVDGTSFSCAYVTGEVANLLIDNPQLTTEELRQYLSNKY